MKYQNNPLNIRYVPSNTWVGQIQPKQGFCQFDTLEHGIRAAVILICKSYAKKGIHKVSDIINRFAPPFENNTTAYILAVTKMCKAVYLREDSEVFLPLHYAHLITAMSKIETGLNNGVNFDSVYYIVCTILKPQQYEVKEIDFGENSEVY